MSSWIHVWAKQNLTKNCLAWITKVLQNLFPEKLKSKQTKNGWQVSKAVKGISNGLFSLYIHGGYTTAAVARSAVTKIKEWVVCMYMPCYLQQDIYSSSSKDTFHCIFHSGRQLTSSEFWGIFSKRVPLWQNGCRKWFGWCSVLITIIFILFYFCRYYAGKQLINKPHSFQF